MKWAERTIRLWDQCWADEKLQREAARINRPLVDWCSRKTWDVFWTQTYRGNHSEDAARSRILYFLAASIWSTMLRDVLWVVEPHKHIQSHHVHLLLSLRRPISSGSCRTPLQVWSRDWRSLKNLAWLKLGKALILPVSPGDGALWYVLKYVTKHVTGKCHMDAKSAGVATPQGLWGIETGPLPVQDGPRSQCQILIDAQEVADYDACVEYFESKGNR